LYTKLLLTDLLLCASISISEQSLFIVTLRLSIANNAHLSISNQPRTFLPFFHVCCHQTNIFPCSICKLNFSLNNIPPSDVCSTLILAASQLVFLFHCSAVLHVLHVMGYRCNRLSPVSSKRILCAGSFLSARRVR